LALSPSGSEAAGLPLDGYTPQEFDTVDPPDEDLGSQALAILPPIPGSKVAHLGVQGGKDGQLRLLNLGDLSGQHGPAHVGGELSKMFVNDLQYGISVQRQSGPIEGRHGVGVF
jgi:hypothetical protein